MDTDEFCKMVYEVKGTEWWTTRELLANPTWPELPETVGRALDLHAKLISMGMWLMHNRNKSKSEDWRIECIKRKKHAARWRVVPLIF